MTLGNFLNHYFSINTIEMLEKCMFHTCPSYINPIGRHESQVKAALLSPVTIGKGELDFLLCPHKEQQSKQKAHSGSPKP